jgi:hypothetical protein
MADVNLNITSDIQSVLNKAIERQRAALQAKLRDDQRKRLEEEIVAKRSKFASSPPRSRISFVPYAEELAANRRIGLDLPFFYLSSSLAGGRFNRPGTRTYTVTSGDGQQTATAQIPDPFPAQFPDLQLPEEASIWQQYPVSGFDFPGNELFPQPPHVQINFGASDGSIGASVRYSKSRFETFSFDGLFPAFPLGDGKCLIVIAVKYALQSWVFERGRWTNFIFDPISYYTNTLESDSVVNAHVAFVCSFTEARQVTLPDVLIEEIYSRLRLARVDRSVFSIDRGTYMQLNNLPYLVNLTLEDIERNPGLGLRLPFNDFVVPYYARNLGGDIFYDELIKLSLGAYGLQVRSTFEAGATPSIWFSIANPPFEQPFSTFEQVEEVSFQEATTQRVTIGQTLRSRSYIGVPAPSSEEGFAPPERVFFWQEGSPSGLLSEGPVVPLPGAPTDSWKEIKNRVSSNFVPTGSWTRYYINEWRNPDFCQSQAERWGVKNL